MNYRKNEIIRCHHGLVPIRFSHCDNQAKIVGTPYVFKIEGITYEGLVYGNIRLHNRYGDPNTTTLLRNDARLQPL